MISVFEKNSTGVGQLYWRRATILAHGNYTGTRQLYWSTATLLAHSFFSKKVMAYS